MKLFAQYHIDGDAEIMEIPACLSDRIAPWAESEFLRFKSGSILEQKFINKYYRIFIYKFYASSDTNFELAFEHPTVAFQTMLRGNISYLFNGKKRIDLQKRKCRLFYFPGGNDKMIINKGECELIHFDFNPYFIELMSSKLCFLQPYYCYLQKQNKDAHVLQPAPIDTFYYYLKKMRYYEDKGNGFDLMYIMEILIEYILEKYGALLEVKKVNPNNFSISGH